MRKLWELVGTGAAWVQARPTLNLALCVGLLVATAIGASLAEVLLLVAVLISLGARALRASMAHRESEPTRWHFRRWLRRRIVGYLLWAGSLFAFSALLKYWHLSTVADVALTILAGFLAMLVWLFIRYELVPRLPLGARQWLVNLAGYWWLLTPDGWRRYGHCNGCGRRTWRWSQCYYNEWGHRPPGAQEECTQVICPRCGFMDFPPKRYPWSYDHPLYCAQHADDRQAGRVRRQRRQRRLSAVK